MLKLDQQTLYSMDVFEFMERVEGGLLWQEQKDDTMLNWLAWYTANQMLSTGNLKKGTNPLTLKKGLYKSMEDLEEENKPAQVKRAESEAQAKAEKERLIKRFNLAPEQLNNG